MSTADRPAPPSPELDALVLQLIAATLEIDAAALAFRGDVLTVRRGEHRTDSLCRRTDPFYSTHEAAAIGALAMRHAARRED